MVAIDAAGRRTHVTCPEIASDRPCREDGGEMAIRVSGKNLDIGESLRTQVEAREIGRAHV